MTLNNLTTGDSYLAYFLHHHKIAGRQRDMRVHFGGGTGDPTTGLFAAHDQGYITTVEFTADSSSQVFLFGADNSTDRALLNGLVLQDLTVPPIPEPAGLGLLGLALMAVRRRRE